MNLNYTPEAEADLDAIHRYLAEQAGAVTADKTVARILQDLAILEKFPLIGRPGRVEHTREWSISGLSYVGIYTLPDAVNVDVIAILHTSRKYPPE